MTVAYIAIGIFALVGAGAIVALQIMADRAFRKIQRDADKAWEKYGL